MRRPALIVLLIVAILALVRLWPDDSATDKAQSSLPERGNEQRLAISANESKSATSPAVEARPAPLPPLLKIDVRVPATAHSGESFEASVDVETIGGIQRLAFTVVYNKSILQLVGSSSGTFVQQWGVPAQFVAQEPSDGNILVNLDVDNGAAIAGAGSVAILQFQALKAGTSPVTVDNVTFAPAGGRGASAPAVQQGSVTVD